MTAETYNGQPCAHGHTLRYRSNRKCVACARREVQYFELDAQGTARAIQLTEATYARLPGRSYWRATRIDC